MAYIDMNFTAHKEKKDKIMASYIYGWIGQKDRDDLPGLIWKEGDVWTSGKTLMKKMKELCKLSDNYMKYRRKLSLLTQGTKAFKTFYSELKDLTNYVKWKTNNGVKNMEAAMNVRTETTSTT